MNATRTINLPTGMTITLGCGRPVPTATPEANPAATTQPPPKPTPPNNA